MTTWPLKPKHRVSMVDYAVLTVVHILDIQSFMGRVCYDAIKSHCMFGCEGMLYGGLWGVMKSY